MKKALKVVGILVGIIIVMIIIALLYVSVSFPRTDPPENIVIKSDEGRIQRGRYLSNNVAGCMGCHSIRDQSKFAGPPKPGTAGGGGDQFDETNDFPGTVVVKNITPASLRKWTDGELIRAITCGVTRENKALFPIMPYPDYNALTREDLYSIIAYLKTLNPIENDLPDSDLNFPLNFIVKTLPLKSYKPAKQIHTSDTVAYGKYLATVASCFGCHTIMNRGRYVEEMTFAGGKEFKTVSGIVRSSNITPSIKTGIGLWSKESFISRFKYFNTDSTGNITVGLHDYNTPMPWTSYAGMTEQDLGAIFEYLQTLKPVENKVQKWTPAHVTK